MKKYLVLLLALIVIHEITANPIDLLKNLTSDFATISSKKKLQTSPQSKIVKNKSSFSYDGNVVKDKSVINGESFIKKNNILYHSLTGKPATKNVMQEYNNMMTGFNQMMAERNQASKRKSQNTSKDSLIKFPKSPFKSNFNFFNEKS